MKFSVITFSQHLATSSHNSSRSSKTSGRSSCFIRPQTCSIIFRSLLPLAVALLLYPCLLMNIIAHFISSGIKWGVFLRPFLLRFPLKFKEFLTGNYNENYRNLLQSKINFFFFLKYFLNGT